MTEQQIKQFFERIDSLTYQHRPLFGIMNVNQMICHCTDFFRMANGTKKALEYGQVDPNEIIALAQSGKSAPTPKGFGQVEGLGTQPSHLETDKDILKKHILEFSELPEEYNYAEHPYFGKLSKKRWTELAIYHLNHHLEQFDV